MLQEGGGDRTSEALTRGLLLARFRLKVYADYLIFMRRLAEEAAKLAAQSGSSHVAAEHIDAAAEVSRPPAAGPLCLPCVHACCLHASACTLVLVAGD